MMYDVRKKGLFARESRNLAKILLQFFKAYFVSTLYWKWLSEGLFQNNSLTTFLSCRIQSYITTFMLFKVRKEHLKAFSVSKYVSERTARDLSTEKFRRLFRDHTLTTLIVILMMTNSLGIQTNYSLDGGSNSRRNVVIYDYTLM